MDLCVNHQPSSDARTLQAILPDGYEHTVCKFTVKEHGSYSTLFRLKLKTEAEAQHWLNSFQEVSKTTFRVQRGKKCESHQLKNVFKAYLRCQHNTLPRSSTADQRANSKNTNCPASMTITVKRVITNRKSRSSDIHANALPMVVQLEYNHNHPVRCADALKHRDVAASVTEKFLSLFQSGHSPSTSLNAHKYDLHERHGDDYVWVSADRAQCPDMQWCFRLYYKTFKKHYGAPDGESVLQDLKKKIASYNLVDQIASMTQVGENICVALCTPLMKRVHRETQQSGELVFLDASGGVNRHGCRVFLMLTHTCAGGVPLGVLVTTSEAEEVVTEGLKLLKGLFPPGGAFFGRGEEGPVVFMTDDSESERKALANVFPVSRLLLCTCHILQAMWRFLWDSKRQIAKEARPHLLRLVKCMLYAETPEQLKEHYADLLRDKTVKKYQSFSKHVQHLYERRNVWAICYRQDLPIRGDNTNNYCEAAMRILKDKIFLRTKAFNMVQLVDFLSTRLEQYYERKLLDVANNRLDRAITSRYQPIINWDLPASSISRLSDHEFEIPSQKKAGVTYHVDMEAGVCSCYIGVQGGPCKHQHMVAKHFFICNINTSPRNSQSLRRSFYKVAVGGEIDDKWFSSLHSRPSSSTSMQDAEVQPAEQSSSTPIIPTSDYTEREASEINPEENDDEEMETHCNEFVKTLKEKKKKSRELFTGPIEAFFRSFNKIKTDSGLISALSTFGKYSCHRLKRAGKMIGVQPTAVARRKTPVGGRRSHGGGRPTKKAGAAMGAGKPENPKLPPTRRRHKAPHKLSTCLARNVSLGKTHSAKM